jgi:hypothetical protein
MKCIVSIPVYKSDPDRYEIVSFNQSLKILFNHPICLVTFENLDISFYTQLFQKSGIKYSVEYFDKSFFESLASYNRLLMLKDFYLRFKEFDYMLIYQLDAYVFRDELDYWCGQGYDFIGAPLLEDKSGIDKKYFLHGGNGGLSLRKISWCIKFLSFIGPVIKPLTVYKILKPEIKGNWFYYFICLILKVLGYHNNVDYFRRKTWINEDMLFNMGLYVAWVDRALYPGETWIYPKLPPKEIAMKFSFERYPSYLYQLNGNKLPFGCHAWVKYEYDTFWKKYIQY